MAATKQLFRRGLASPSVSLLLLSFIQLALWQSVVLSFTLSFTGSESQMRQERTSISSPRKQTRLFLETTKRTLPLAFDSIANTTTSSPSYTLQYSPNFQRHIVRRIIDTTNTTDTSAADSIAATEGVVVESFQWLDQAVERYPSAKLFAVGMEACVIR
jgi:hypothetical protein